MAQTRSLYHSPRFFPAAAQNDTSLARVDASAINTTVILDAPLPALGGGYTEFFMKNLGTLKDQVEYGYLYGILDATITSLLLDEEFYTEEATEARRLVREDRRLAREAKASAERGDADPDLAPRHNAFLRHQEERKRSPGIAPAPERSPGKLRLTPGEVENINLVIRTCASMLISGASLQASLAAPVATFIAKSCFTHIFVYLGDTRPEAEKKAGTLAGIITTAALIACFGIFPILIGTAAAIGVSVLLKGSLFALKRPLSYVSRFTPLPWVGGGAAPRVPAPPFPLPQMR